jgi:hypothetical protein
MDTCSHKMTTQARCERIVYVGSVGEPEVCIMHSADPAKDITRFDKELRVMRSGKRQDSSERPDSLDHQDSGPDFDFTGFIFAEPYVLAPAPLDMHFENARFLKSLTVDAPWYRSQIWHERVEFGGRVSFSGAWFATAVFDGAEFIRSVEFQAAHFAGDVSFGGVVFGGGVTFSQAHFAAAVRFVDTSFGPKKIVEDTDPVDSKRAASFIEAVFEKPEWVMFRDVNVKAQQGLRLRARACDVEKFRFQNVRWHCDAGRIVLQDELDLRAAVRLRPSGKSLRRYRRNLYIQARYGSFEEYPRNAHASVTVTYNQLIRNFDETLDSDAAEDAFRGAMEMKRLAPENRLFNRQLHQAYDRIYWLGAASSWFSVAAGYKIVSEYGSSYRRAFMVLAFLLVIFSVTYARVGGLVISPNVTARAKALPTSLMAGLAAIEVASFQRDVTVMITTPAGRAVRLIESIVVPGQVAIVLLALRRRFKR